MAQTQLHLCIMSEKKIGSSFDAFLQEDSILADVSEVAIERIVDWLGAEALKAIEPDL